MYTYLQKIQVLYISRNYDYITHKLFDIFVINKTCLNYITYDKTIIIIIFNNLYYNYLQFNIQ